MREIVTTTCCSEQNLWACPSVQLRAAVENSPKRWDHLWAAPETRDWRGEAMRSVYERIAELLPKGSTVIDVGGGVGMLAGGLKEKGHTVTVWDHSAVALVQAREAGLETEQVNLLTATAFAALQNAIVVSTEVLEHLPEDVRSRLLTAVAASGKLALFSVPHDRLSPLEEPQHTIKWTALEFRTYLRQWWPTARVECLGKHYQYMLGVCGEPAKAFKLSVTMPVRDEAADLGRTLASFMGAADEIVIGLDPRTVDGTREVAEKFGTVFELAEMMGPEGDQVPEGGVHFAHVRNQCIDHCTGDWIFMSEGHERLLRGTDVLIQIDSWIPKHCKMAFVLRTGQGQQWAFPWLFKKDPEYRFKRSTHNILDFPAGSFYVRLPQVATEHERDHRASVQRREQRRVQNRKDLFEDWLENGNENSLFYLGSEWREWDEERARVRLEQLLAMPAHNGAQRYQARLLLAKIYMRRAQDAKGEQEKKQAWDTTRNMLLGCTAEDWSRTEHWLWLGDIAYDQERYEEALQFYRYNATVVGTPPFTLWWIDMFVYGHIGAQRMALVYGALGNAPKALEWANKVLELLPEGAPQASIDEATRNIKHLEGCLGEQQEKDDA